MIVQNGTEEHFTNYGTLYDPTSLGVLIISIIGVGGNLSTLCAFQYARIKKRYNFHVSWNHIVVFLWNLAFIDFFSSINMTMLYVLFVFYPDGINQYTLCVSMISLRDIFVLISGTSVACIAVATLIGVTKNNLWMNFCDNELRVNFLIALCWMLGVICYIAKIVKVGNILRSIDNERPFDCGTFFFKLDVSVETFYSEFILHTIVISVIIVSYGLITMYATRISNDVDTRREGVGIRDQNTSKMVFLICLVYMLQCVPYMICRFFLANHLRTGFFIQFAWPAKVSYIVYYTQFFPNMFIYVARNEHYRKAYLYWINSVFCFKSLPNSGYQSRENTIGQRHETGMSERRKSRRSEKIGTPV